jgi:dihydroorotate dehydrogenase (NAD+) catalytic subunit
VSLETKIGAIRLKNPVLVASGTFGHAKEFEKFIDLTKLGGIVTKTITIKPRLGNPPQRIVETPSGMLNAIGLQNPGAAKFVEEKLPYLRKLKIPVIASAMGYSIEEFVAVIQILEKAGGIDGYELN